MTKQPEALRLADDAEDLPVYSEKDGLTFDSVAMELRRLHKVNAELLAALKLIAGAPWVENCLDPQRAGKVAKAAIAKATGETE